MCIVSKHERVELRQAFHFYACHPASTFGAGPAILRFLDSGAGPAILRFSDSGAGPAILRFSDSLVAVRRFCNSVKNKLAIGIYSTKSTEFLIF